MVAIENCPFCEIVSREETDVREIYRDEHVVLIFPLEPATLGHAMVIPRDHLRDVWEIDSETASRIAWATVRLAHAIRRAMQPDGLNVIQSNGKAASQTVMHMHVHVVPRYHNDGIGQIWPPETAYAESQKDTAWVAIRAAYRDVDY
jgi:histidine triad (HIT) family protein